MFPSLAFICIFLKIFHPSILPLRERGRKRDRRKWQLWRRENLVRNKMGRCDNPLKGIYNPYEIKKQSFCLSIGGGVSALHIFRTWTKVFKSVHQLQLLMRIKLWSCHLVIGIKLSSIVADTTMMNSLFCPLCSNPEVHLNLISQGILAIQNSVNPSKTMPC